MPSQILECSHLLSRFIDHAPTFPPAQMDIDDALIEDGRARESSSSFMLGRLVWPSSRVHELGSLDRRLSVVLDSEFVPDPRIVSVEVPALPTSRLQAQLSLPIYVELTIDASLESRLTALGELGLLAKVRCGGERVPTGHELARFVRACRSSNVAFKATAGLHKAVRRGSEHGFLNLLAAAIFVGEEEEALAESMPSAFALDGSQFRWRNRYATLTEAADARRLLHAIGSCSFFEPVAELKSLGIMS
jgi:hypothetical protein